VASTLIIFTEAFPFGQTETYLENEFPFLLNSFDRIFVVSINTSGEQTRKLPDRVKVIRKPYNTPYGYILRALFFVSKSEFWEEIRFIRKKLCLTLSIDVLRILISSYGKALEVSDWLDRFIIDEKIDKNNLYLYSYWLNNVSTGLALYKEKNHKVKAFCRTHGWDVYYELHKPAYLPLRSYTLSRLDACFCISEFGQDYLRNLVGRPTQNNVLVSYLGTNNPIGLRGGSKNSKIVLVSCSHVYLMKRIQIIIEALARINLIELEWFHFGDGPLMEANKALAKKLLDNKANLKYHFKGHVLNKEVLDFYRNNSVDLFITVSGSEGLPVSIMEANSFGIPALATNVGGNSEIVKDEINGLLLDPNCSINDVVKAIKRYYYLSENEKSQMRNNAYNNWNDRFNADKNYPAFIKTVLEF